MELLEILILLFTIWNGLGFLSYVFKVLPTKFTFKQNIFLCILCGPFVWLLLFVIFCLAWVLVKFENCKIKEYASYFWNVTLGEKVKESDKPMEMDKEVEIKRIEIE